LCPDQLQDGVILGADTRATEGEIVCDKNCEKIHYLAPNISCCGAGTAADTENVTGTHLPLYSTHLPSGGIAICLLRVLHSSSFSIPLIFHFFTGLS
jgi:20S proteasome subunit beta 2